MWKQRTLKKETRKSMKLTYINMICVCFMLSVLTTAYPFSTTFINLQKMGGPQYSDAIFTLSIPNSEAITETISLILERSDFFKLVHNTFFHIASLLIDLFSTSISVFFNSLRTINAFFTENFSITLIFLMLGLAVTIFYHFFINYVLIIGEKRFFLENRKYKKTPISKIFYLYKLRCISNPVWIMFCRSAFQTLWNCTIVGGFIKYYEYSLIPFILAENPKISRRDAFFLSKQLMNKNKFKVFLLDLSFVGWKLLSILSFGLLDFLFVNPYITGCKTELYATLRREYVLSRSPRYEALNDSYLEHVPSEDELLISKALYDDSRGPYTKISYFEPDQYPVFLFSVQPKTVKPAARVFRNYDTLTCIFLFYAFSCFGWITEALIHLMRDGEFTGSHILFGPWLPLYGLYGVFIIKAAKKFFKKPVSVFLFNFASFSILQYAFSFFVELIFHRRIWDYSEFLLNLHGRIYVGGSVAFALLGCAYIYYIAPTWADFFGKLSRTTKTAICAVLTLIFVADIILTKLL